MRPDGEDIYGRMDANLPRRRAGMMFRKTNLLPDERFRQVRRDERGSMPSWSARCAERPLDARTRTLPIVMVTAKAPRPTPCAGSTRARAAASKAAEGTEMPE